VSGFVTRRLKNGNYVCPVPTYCAAVRLTVNAVVNWKLAFRLLLAALENVCVNIVLLHLLFLS